MIWKLTAMHEPHAFDLSNMACPGLLHPLKLRVAFCSCSRQIQAVAQAIARLARCNELRPTPVLQPTWPWKQSVASIPKPQRLPWLGTPLLTDL